MSSQLKFFILASLMAALTAVGAQIRIPMLPVPFTLQTLFVLLAGNLIGPNWGAVSMLIYLAMGLIGLPVFAGTSGLGIIFTPTFGYLISFPICAYWVGKSVSKIRANNRYFTKAMITNLGGQLWIFGFGVVYLWLISNLYLENRLSISNAVFAGFVVFIPSMIIKAIIAAWITNHMKIGKLI